MKAVVCHRVGVVEAVGAQIGALNGVLDACEAFDRRRAGWPTQGGPGSPGVHRMTGRAGGSG